MLRPAGSKRAHRERVLVARAAIGSAERNLGQRDRRVAVFAAFTLGALVAVLPVPASGSSLGPIREVKLVEGAETLALSSKGSTALFARHEPPPPTEGNAGASLLARVHGTWAVQAGPFRFPGATVGGAALSASGDTALFGLPFSEHSSATLWGQVAVLTRRGSAWSQQEIIDNPASSQTYDFGSSVALSSDGNTALVQSQDNYEAKGEVERPTAYVYAREGSVWTRQGAPLTFRTEGPYWAGVALSADGNTALVDVFRQWLPDNSKAERIEAVWVFTRSGSTWAFQGELVPTAGEEVGPIQGEDFGEAIEGSVALSSDGNTALVGIPTDNSGVGAVWAFKRTGSTWTQQGSKITGREEEGTGGFGARVALNSKGNVALIGGSPCGGTCGGKLHGAVWVFKRKGSTWKQQAPPLTCNGCEKLGQQLALSGNAKRAVVSVLP
jgi:hypothetical protein